MRGAFSGRFQFFAVVIMIVASMVIYYVAKRPELAPAFPVDVPPAAAVATIIAFAPWAYVGFDSIPQLAGEFNFSPKKALGLLMWGSIAATLIYLAMMLATSIAAGAQHDLYEGEAWPPAAAISEVMGPAGLGLMVVAVSAGVLTGLNGFFTVASRVLFTLGRANLVSSRLGELNGKERAPRNAILLVCAVCLVTPWFGCAALTWVVDMSTAGIEVAYFYTCFCAWKIARTGQVSGMSKPIAPNKFYEYFALAGVHPLRRVLGAALRFGLAWHAGNGSAHRAGGVDCAGAGDVGHQEPAAEGCAAGGDGVVDSGIAGRLRSCARTPAEDLSL